MKPKSGSTFSGKSILHKLQWWLYLRTIVLVVRVIVFEKYTVVTALLWLLLTGLLALLAFFIHYGITLAVVVFSLLFYTKVQKYLLEKQYLLIRPGDRVEYAVSGGDETLQTFATAKVLRRMRARDLAKSSLFDSEYLDLYEHFYLVDSGEKNEVIAYEWIIGIEAGDLDV